MHLRYVLRYFLYLNGKAGIADSATTAVFYIFNKFYVENRYGQGMAAAVILFGSNFNYLH